MRTVLCACSRSAQICAFLVRAEAWLAHGVNDPAMCFGMEDLESHVRMSTAGVRGIAIPEPLFSYRKRAGSMSRAFEPHATAYLYRRIRRANPALFRRFGPELVGLYAENGHGASAPSVCEPSPAHTALFGRDIPGLNEVADDLERHASRERLGRALRARCALGGVEWDYTTARLLLALDRAPGFARQLLRAAVGAEPDNGWFRLYAMIAELRDGRFGAAQALGCARFHAFCGEEAGAVRWIAALEAVRGFPHVTLALRALLGDACGAPLTRPPTHSTDLEAADAEPGEFADLHRALDMLRDAPSGRPAASLRDKVLAEARRHVSPAAAEALLGRWLTTWRRREEPISCPWGQAASAYLSPATLGGPTATAAQEMALWMAVAAGERIPASQRLRRTLGRVARAVIEPV